MNGLLEILTNKQWMMDPDALHSIRALMQTNLQGHISQGVFVKKKSFAADYHHLDASDYLQTEDGDTYDAYSISRIDRPFVNVIVIDGPITRNGGACSYGSLEHRDMIMAAADNPLCHGHVFYLNTPGGSAWAKNDYMQAIDYARGKGQPVYAFIDGVCASAGMYVAAMCDRRFYMHPQNEIGCIGTMAAFYTQKDGSHNQFSDETYHEIYDPESFDKNKWIRDIVNDGNTQLLVDELVALSIEFRSYVSARCPNVEDEHLHGKVFKAEEVKGILVDEKSTLNEVIALCFEAGAANVRVDSDADTDEPENKYRNIAGACGVESLVIGTDGTFLSIDMLDSLSSSLSTLTGENASLMAAKDEAYSFLETERNRHREGLDALRSSCFEEIAALNAQHEADLASVNTEKAALKVQLSEAQQAIADRDATIAELTKEASRIPAIAPVNNGTGTEQTAIVTMPTYDSALTPEENQRIRNEWKSKYNI